MLFFLQSVATCHDYPEEFYVGIPWGLWVTPMHAHTHTHTMDTQILYTQHTAYTHTHTVHTQTHFPRLLHVPFLSLDNYISADVNDDSVHLSCSLGSPASLKAEYSVLHTQAAVCSLCWELAGVMRGWVKLYNWQQYLAWWAAAFTSSFHFTNQIGPRSWCLQDTHALLSAEEKPHLLQIKLNIG